MARGGFGTLRRGQVLDGRYRVEELVGRGGMSEVASATELPTGRTVALKVLHAERARSPKDVARLVREARAIGRLSSPHVARLFDTGTYLDEGVEIPYLVLELVDGVNLATWLRAKGRLDAPAAARMIWQACDAIAEAHAHGLVHRDIKPANLMLTASAAGELVTKVLDFGIACECKAQDARLTGTGDLVGSPVYMAPEQMRPGSEVDARADVWSLGVVLFEALAGRLPFESPSLPDLCLKILLDEPPPLPDDVPAALVAIVRRCLAKAPSERYASAREVAEVLRPLAGLSFSMSPTDIELAALDAAARDHAPSGDAARIETRPGAAHPRRWRRVGIVAVALALVFGLAIGRATLGAATGPAHRQGTVQATDTSSVGPIERSIVPSTGPMGPAPAQTPAARTVVPAPAPISQRAPAAVASHRSSARTANRAPPAQRGRTPAPAGVTKPTSIGPSSARPAPMRDPLASPF